MELTGGKHSLDIIGDIAEYSSVALGAVGLRGERLDLDTLDNGFLDFGF